MLSAEDVKVSLYKSPDECQSFQCEKRGYADFIQDANEALKCQSDNLSVTYLFKKDSTPIGYVTLAMGSLQKKRLPKDRKEAKRFPNVPSLLLGQLARDQRYKGQGVGEIMIDWVLRTANDLSQRVGCRYVILDAELDKIAHYKKHFGFQDIPREPGDTHTIMFFDLKTGRTTKRSCSVLL